MDKDNSKNAPEQKSKSKIYFNYRRNMNLYYERDKFEHLLNSFYFNKNWVGESPSPFGEGFRVRF